MEDPRLVELRVGAVYARPLVEGDEEEGENWLLQTIDYKIDRTVNIEGFEVSG